MRHALWTTAAISLAPATALACGNAMLINYTPSTQTWFFSALFSILFAKKFQKLRPGSMHLQLATVAAFYTGFPLLYWLLGPTSDKVVLLGISVWGIVGMFFGGMLVSDILINRGGEDTGRITLRGLGIAAAVIFASIALGVGLELAEPEGPESEYQVFSAFDESQNTNEVTF